MVRLFFLVILISACSANRNLQKDKQDVSDSTSTEQRDGSTKESAIPVKSIDEEYKWIKANYPGSKVISQALIGDKKRHYDLLTFVTSSGETKKTYFDISSFFGKF